MCWKKMMIKKIQILKISGFLSACKTTKNSIFWKNGFTASLNHFNNLFIVFFGQKKYILKFERIGQFNMTQPYGPKKYWKIFENLTFLAITSRNHYQIHLQMCFKMLLSDSTATIYIWNNSRQAQCASAVFRQAQ